jgi:hypothetical protein
MTTVNLKQIFGAVGFRGGGRLDRWSKISESSLLFNVFTEQLLHSLLSLSSEYRRLMALHVEGSASVTCSSLLFMY